MEPKPRLFLDTSALFSGIWSAQGGARMLLKLGEAGAVQLLVGPSVLQEIELVIRQKAPAHLPVLVILLDRSRLEVVPAAPVGLIERCRSLVLHPGDAQILADAWSGAAIFLATHDRAHLLKNPSLTESLPFTIGTPGDCLSWYRDTLRKLP